MNYLVIVDMQKDFSPPPEVENYIRELFLKIADLPNWNVLFTQDWHDKNIYSLLQESRKFSPHCLANTEGVNIVNSLQKYATNDYCWKKETFMPIGLSTKMNCGVDDLIVVCGICTHICVLNTALYLRACFPFTSIVVDLDGCGGSSDIETQAAICIMRSSAITMMKDNKIC